MRTFISLELPEEIRKEIIQIQKKIPEFSGRKTEPENLHLTLKFLGEISEQEVEKIKARLREIKLKKFQAEISELGVFNPNFVKIIWLKINGCDELQKIIDNKLENLFPKEKRFMSHLTIARVKKINDKDKFISKLKNIKTKNIKFNISNFFLKKSTLTSEKPVYEIIEEFNLI